MCVQVVGDRDGRINAWCRTEMGGLGAREKDWGRGQHTGVHTRGLAAAAGRGTVSGLQRSMSSPNAVSNTAGSARSVPGRRLA